MTVPRRRREKLFDRISISFWPAASYHTYLLRQNPSDLKRYMLLSAARTENLLCQPTLTSVFVYGDCCLAISSSFFQKPFLVKFHCRSLMMTTAFLQNVL